MDTIVVLAAALFVFGLALYALERLPLPAQPAWLRRGLEAVLAVIGCYWLWQHFLPH